MRTILTIGVFVVLAACALSAESDITFNKTAFAKEPKIVSTYSDTDKFYTNGFAVTGNSKKNLVNFTAFNDTGNDSSKQDMYRRPFNYDTLAYDGAEQAVPLGVKGLTAWLEAGDYYGFVTAALEEATNKTQIRLHKAKANKEDTFTPITITTASENITLRNLEVQDAFADSKNVYILYTETKFNNETSDFDFVASTLAVVEWKSGEITHTATIPLVNATEYGAVFNPGKNWITLIYEKDVSQANESFATRFYTKNNSWADTVTVYTDTPELRESARGFVDANGFDLLVTRTRNNDSTIYTYYAYILGDGLSKKRVNFKTDNLNTSALNTSYLEDILPYKTGFIAVWEVEYDANTNNTHILYEVYDKEAVLTEQAVEIYQLNQNATSTGMQVAYLPNKGLLTLVTQKNFNGTDTNTERLWAGILIDNMGTFGSVLKTVFVFVGLVASALFVF